MARRVFFSFHYDRDAWRAGQVRNSNRIVDENSTGRFTDKADWESIKYSTNKAIQNWIDDQLRYTSVTVVLIGQETANRPWVQYEIQQSRIKRNGMLGIYIDSIAAWRGGVQTYDLRGNDPFQKVADPLRPGYTLYGLYNTYNWSSDSYLYLPQWIDDAYNSSKR